MCVRVSVYTRTYRNNASIFHYSSFSGSKVNLVGALRSFFEFPNNFQKHRKKQNKLRNKGNFYAKSVFDQINFLYYLLFYRYYYIIFFYNSKFLISYSYSD
ncbi:Uncharacterized protein FWK35_00023694 [Aphis craccivora]|uniref:Uncharacterized protein n=1 Tax=Aphis craccivora TaxID=307492 RepID=A0A6G0Y613_APHCR|nr:Uncharacterized protein FWK35_00023694 [Aphis craccivora]